MKYASGHRRATRDELGSRSRTYGLRTTRRVALQVFGEPEPYPEDVVRPRTRSECAGGQRPCPFIACRHHIAVDVDPNSGAVTLNWPDRDLSELQETCSLDVADRGGTTLDRVGELMNLTHERIRQIEDSIAEKGCESFFEDDSARHGAARQGWAWRGMARRGKARQGKGASAPDNGIDTVDNALSLALICTVHAVVHRSRLH